MSLLFLDRKYTLVIVYGQENKLDIKATICFKKRIGRKIVSAKIQNQVTCFE